MYVFGPCVCVVFSLYVLVHVEKMYKDNGEQR